MIDFYLEYSRWYLSHYGRPFPCTREEWTQWCSHPAPQERLPDIQFDYNKETLGDAQ